MSLSRIFWRTKLTCVPAQGAGITKDLRKGFPAVRTTDGVEFCRVAARGPAQSPAVSRRGCKSCQMVLALGFYPKLSFSSAPLRLNLRRGEGLAGPLPAMQNLVGNRVSFLPWAQDIRPMLEEPIISRGRRMTASQSH